MFTIWRSKSVKISCFSSSYPTWFHCCRGIPHCTIFSILFLLLSVGVNVLLIILTLCFFSFVNVKSQVPYPRNQKENDSFLVHQTFGQKMGRRTFWTEWWGAFLECKLFSAFPLNAILLLSFQRVCNCHAFKGLFKESYKLGFPCYILSHKFLRIYLFLR